MSDDAARRSPDSTSDPAIGRVLLTEEQLPTASASSARRSPRTTPDRRPLLVCVLKGAFVFMTDLARAIDLPVEIDFMAVSSYGASTRTSGVVRLVKDLDVDLTGRDVILVEDIVDTRPDAALPAPQPRGPRPGQPRGVHPARP